jgi:hypothetical protein
LKEVTEYIRVLAPIKRIQGKKRFTPNTKAMDMALLE